MEKIIDVKFIANVFVNAKIPHYKSAIKTTNPLIIFSDKPR